MAFPEKHDINLAEHVSGLQALGVIHIKRFDPRIGLKSYHPEESRCAAVYPDRWEGFKGNLSFSPKFL